MIIKRDKDLITKIKDDERKLENKKLAVKHLGDTDWYVIRFVETGEDIPQEVKKSRSDSRKLLSDK